MGELRVPPALCWQRLVLQGLLRKEEPVKPVLAATPGLLAAHGPLNRDPASPHSGADVAHVLGNTQAPAWPAACLQPCAAKAPRPMPASSSAGAQEPEGRPQTLTPAGAAMERALLAVSRALVAAAPDLDALDARHASHLDA